MNWWKNVGLWTLGFMSLSLTAQADNDSTDAATVKIAWESQVRSFDPRGAVDANSQYLEDLIHCSLISFDRAGNIQPQLAANKPKWIEPTTLHLKLRKNIKFSDGKPVTAADVKATYQSLIDSRDFARRLAFKDVKSITTPKPNELEFHLQKPDATFVSNLVVGILPKDVIAANKGPLKQSPGCGPFQIAGTDVNELTLEPNPHYSLGPKPKVNKVLIKIVKSEKTRFAKLRAGEIDIAQNNINRELVDDVQRKYPGLEVMAEPALKTTYLGFNMKDPITGNPAVRQAIAHAIHRPSIIKLLLGGLATPASSLLPPSSPYFNDKIDNPAYDVAKANAILDKADLPKKGRYRFKISYKTTIDATRINIARAVASQLKKIGIDVVVEPMEWGRFKQDVESGRVQMWGLTWVGFKDPDILRYAFASESIPPNGGNRGHYQNKKLDQLLAKGRTTLNEEKRKDIYFQAQKIIANELPYIFLWHEQNFAIVNQRLKGFQLYADGRLSSLARVAYESK
jgi:peptide/nickel transport system substrate-binding protein